MNEVEKMYRNAHVYPRVYGDITKNTFENKVFNMADMCNEAFTAEKQLELIKWLIIEGYIEDMLTVQISEENFEVCLADTFNELWQDLTEEERKQIKEILE